MNSPHRSSPSDSRAQPAGNTLLTLAIVFHGFFVLVAITANLDPSPLQAQILNRFKSYTRLFNFDLNFTPYHLTHATEMDVDHRIEVLPEGKRADALEDWLVLPAGGFRGCDSYQRYQRLGAIWDFQSQGDGEPARFAQAIGNHFLRQREVPPQQVRCRRHYLLAPEDVTDGTQAQRDPNDPSRFVVVYAANAIVTGGYVDVVRVDEASQVAQPTRPRNSSNEPASNEPRR